MTVLLVFGTRPEAIKLGPCAAELRALRVPFGVLSTGQHQELLKGTPAETDLAGGVSLGIPSKGKVIPYVTDVANRAEQWLREHEEYEIVVVQGDTMSALAVAQAAVQADRLVVHVEAGVRSGDLDNPWPEEETRIQITKLASWHYAATPTAFANLLAEGVPHERIRLTGNPVVSAIARYSNAVPRAPMNVILFTMHRREWAQGEHVQEVVEALKEAAFRSPEVKFVWPVHPALEGKIEVVTTENLLICDPLRYQLAVEALAAAMGVITDSGGLCEESATLGVPCAVMRWATDRPEALEAGVARLFPPTGEGVRNAVDCLLGGQLPRRPTELYGDVTSAAQVARLLAQLVGN